MQRRLNHAILYTQLLCLLEYSCTILSILYVVTINNVVRVSRRTCMIVHCKCLLQVSTTCRHCKCPVLDGNTVTLLGSRTTVTGLLPYMLCTCTYFRTHVERRKMTSAIAMVDLGSTFKSVPSYRKVTGWLFNGALQRFHI